MAEKFAFLDVFPCCATVSELCGGLQNAYLNSVLVDKESRTMLVDAFFSRMPAPAETRILEDKLCAEFGLAQAEVRADYPRVSAPAPAKESKAGGASKQTVLMGKAIKAKPVSMDTLTLESGSVTVSGRVFATDSREIAKRQAAVLSFCITDDTNSIKVSKYLRDTDPEREVVGKISDGMYLTISGAVSYNRFDDDMVLEPRHIQTADAPPVRQDTAEEKRVELHLHTSFSTLDALTNVEKAVKRAAKWGHKAIAITDHGCAQAFPDAWHAGEKPASGSFTAWKAISSMMWTSALPCTGTPTRRWKRNMSPSTSSAPACAPIGIV